MLEVEVKFRHANPQMVMAKLRMLGAQKIEERTDVDHYFNAPDRDFKQTDEAFRLRRIGSRNRLTYKGPKRDAETKTRTEIELALSAGDAVAEEAVQMFTKLGFRPVAIVTKSRTVYHLDHVRFEIEACMDDVEGVGSFVELEIMTEESRYEDAKAVVLKLAEDLGLKDQERRSYLQLLLGE